LLGLSLGGLVAACAGARDGQVAALVLWSAVADLAELVRERWQMPTEPGDAREQNYYEHGAHEIGAEFIRDALQVRPLEEITRFDGPVLVVHGDADEGVPPSHAERYMGAITSADAQLRMIAGGDHTFSTRALEREVIGLTTDFFADRLGTPNR
jgi:dipeptidyl aminopeptidase/acylaminoacyl peptidase